MDYREVYYEYGEFEIAGIVAQKKEAEPGKGEDFETILKKAPDVEPEPYDRLTKA